MAKNDSSKERDFASLLEAHSQEIEVYMRLPRGFYISISSLELCKIEEAKAHCAREHFRAISSENIKYDVGQLRQAVGTGAGINAP